MPPYGDFTIFVPESESGMRLDVFIAQHLHGHSRAFAAKLIKKENIRINGKPRKAGYLVRYGQKIQVEIPVPEKISYDPEPVEINILFEDMDIIVVNKQPGLVVHPAPGNYSGTLVNGLLFHCPDLGGIGGELRPGIVHRLDKETSGTMVVAKNDSSLQHLSRQFKSRKVEKRYLALVRGEFRNEKGEVDLPIGRHPVERKKMSTRSRKGRRARTVWKVRERFRGATLLDVRLETGRTHQVRVHCAAIKHPVIGDPVYGRGSGEIAVRRGKGLPDMVKKSARQMLHAWKLGFVHPSTEEFLVFESPVPADMEEMVCFLRENSRFPNL